MKTPRLRWFRSHPKTTAVLLLLLAFLLLNALAYRHAYAMTHFTAGDDPPTRPEALSGWHKIQVLVAGQHLAKPVNTSTPARLGLAFSVHTLAGTDGVLEAWYIPHPGPKALVVLCHGYAASKASLLAEAAAFHHLGYAAFLLDFRGCGGSSGRATTIGVAEAEDVARAVAYARTLAPELPVVVFGQSMGSAAILRAAAHGSIRPAAAVLECPFDRLLTTVENRFALLHVPAFPAAPLLVFWGGVQHGFNGFAHNPVDYAREVHCPVLLLHGDQDTRVTCPQAEAIFRNLAGPKRFALFAGVGHQSYVRARPETWQHLVGAFLAPSEGFPDMAGRPRDK